MLNLLKIFATIVDEVADVLEIIICQSFVVWLGAKITWRIFLYTFQFVSLKWWVHWMNQEIIITWNLGIKKNNIVIKPQNIFSDSWIRTRHPWYLTKTAAFSPLSQYFILLVTRSFQYINIPIIIFSPFVKTLIRSDSVMIFDLDCSANKFFQKIQFRLLAAVVRQTIFLN